MYDNKMIAQNTQTLSYIKQSAVLPLSGVGKELASNMAMKAPLPSMEVGADTLTGRSAVAHVEGVSHTKRGSVTDPFHNMEDLIVWGIPGYTRCVTCR